jgi:hypothetical protein
VDSRVPQAFAAASGGSRSAHTESMRCPINMLSWVPSQPCDTPASSALHSLSCPAPTWQAVGHAWGEL